MEYNDITLRIRLCTPEELPEAPYHELVLRARVAAAGAYAKYSAFHVGAAVLLENGQIYTANNQENAAYPSGLCAERVAVFYANAQHPDIPVRAIAVAACKDGQLLEAPVPPCGACRQVLLETEQRFEHPVEIVLAGTQKIALISSAADLLPFQFGSHFL